MAIFKKKIKENKDKVVENANGTEVKKGENREVKSDVDSYTSVAKKELKNKTMTIYGNILISPRVTEKGTDLSMNNAYVFNVDTRANKKEIGKAIKEVYGVDPIKVCTLPIQKKTVFTRGKKGVKSGGKKAVVYLREGDKIEFV